MRGFMKRLIMIVVLSFGVVAPLAALPAGAVDVYQPCSDPVNAATAVCKEAASGGSVADVIKAIVNVLLYITGIVSVVVIIIGGVMYATSAGDQAAVGKAKNAILYAVVGLVVALLGLAIVNWVLRLFGI